MRYLKNRWPNTKLKCFDSEKALHSTTLEPIHITSISGAFVTLSIMLVAAFGSLLCEICKFNKENSSVTKGKMRRKVNDHFGRNDEKQMALQISKASWKSFTENIENCEFNQQYITDLVAELDAHLTVNASWSSSDESIFHIR